MDTILMVTTILFTTFLAGVFLAFSLAVNGGLGKLNDDAYLRAMQNINRVILNPVFMAIFMGPVILLPLVTLLYGGSFGTVEFTTYLAAAVLYVVGPFGITIAGNVPLNEKLNKFSIDDASADERSAMRTAYEKPWNRLHTVRTVLAAVSAALVLFAAISL